MNMIQSFNDRASAATIAILEIIDDVEREPDLEPGELQLRIWRRLREEFDDIAREMAAGQKEESEMSDTYEMGPASAGPDLRGMRFDDAVDAVVSWFNANFEDPAESTPYETAEGGYIYIWGGPYDAREEIYNEFGDAISEVTVEAAVELIEEDGWEWAPSQPRMVEERAIGSTAS
jgi:hypothetical protein